MSNSVRKARIGQMYGIGIMAFVLYLSTLIGVPVLPKLSVELGAGATEIPIIVSAALAQDFLVAGLTTPSWLSYATGADTADVVT